MDAEFGGLGIEITLENKVLTVISPIEDTPAFKAGLKPGDKIIKINGEDTKNMTIMKAVKMMRGHKGTKVTLTIMREGFKKFRDFTITRDIIHVHSIKEQIIEPGYVYLKIVSFQKNTDSELTKAIKEAQARRKLCQGRCKITTERSYLAKNLSGKPQSRQLYRWTTDRD